MHYERQYPLADPTRWDRAIQDSDDYNPKVRKVITEWFATYWRKCKTIHDRKVAIRSAHLAAAFGGVQGFPVRAIIHRALGKH